MPPKTQQKTKAQKAAAASASKNKKKKWSKGKVREQANHMTLFDAETFKRLEKEVPKMKMISLSTVSERLKINSSLARKACRMLCEKGVIRKVYHSQAQSLWTRATNVDEE
jgi:small subunit ribosomal protein S25e